jgi:pumilio family protein 6
MVASSPSTGNKRKSQTSTNYKGKKPKQQPDAAGTKRQLKHERQSTRRHADAVTSAKELWNKLRQKSNTPEINRKLMDELMPLIRGKANEVALQHDASRVVQSAVQFGTKEERREIVKELTATAGNLAELAKSQYAHFCVLKILKYCYMDDVCTKLILRNLRTHMASLAVHAVASRVVESLWTSYGEKKLAALRYELYGPHFGLFVTDAETSPKTLTQLLEENPSKKEQVLGFVLKLLQKGMEKSLYGFSYFQELMADYCDNADGKEIRKNLCSSASDHAIHLLAGRPGTRAAATLSTYSTPKDRKALLKSLKGYALSGLLHRDAYLAMIRLVQVTDDTVTVNKYIMQELVTAPKDDEEGDNTQHPMLQLALSDVGSKFLLMQLTEPSDRKFLDPYERSILGDESPTIQDDDGSLVPCSKKDPAVRRGQMLEYIKESLLQICVDHASELLLSRPGAVVLRHVYTALGQPETLIASILDACKATEDETSIFEDKQGHLAVKQLLLEDGAERKPFATAFFSTFGSMLKDIGSSNRGAFVLVALCKAGMKDKVKGKLDITRLKKLLLQKDSPTAGFAALLQELK